MQAGKLRDRITIGRRTVTGLDSMNEDTVTWPSLGAFWAEVLPFQGRELEAAQQKWAEARFKIRLRAQPGIIFVTTDRITWGTRTLDILDAEDIDQRKRELRFTAREIK